MNCSHEKFNIEWEIDKVVDEEKNSRAFFCQMRIRCEQCKEYFSFIGVPSFQKNIYTPTTSEDFNTLHLPIIPSSNQGFIPIIKSDNTIVN